MYLTGMLRSIFGNWHLFIRFLGDISDRRPGVYNRSGAIENTDGWNISFDFLCMVISVCYGGIFIRGVSRIMCQV